MNVFRTDHKAYHVMVIKTAHTTLVMSCWGWLIQDVLGGMWPKVRDMEPLTQSRLQEGEGHSFLVVKLWRAGNMVVQGGEKSKLTQRHGGSNCLVLLLCIVPALFHSNPSGISLSSKYTVGLLKSIQHKHPHIHPSAALSLSRVVPKNKCRIMTCHSWKSTTAGYWYIAGVQYCSHISDLKADQCMLRSHCEKKNLHTLPYDPIWPGIAKH